MTEDLQLEWLASEIQSVRWRGFFVTGRDPAQTTTFLSSELARRTPPTYVRFLSKFGGSNLYLRDNAFRIGIRSCPQVVTSARSGEHFLEFGNQATCSAYFRMDDLASAREVEVVERRGLGLVGTGLEFGEWLRDAARKAHRLLGKRRWAQVLDGPIPFSDAERAIVQARRLFRWRGVGRAPDGKTLFEVRNESKMVLPILTIAVRASDGKLNGMAIRLRTSGIAPGTVAQVAHDAYRKLLAEGQAIFEDTAEPTPELRDTFWEFMSDDEVREIDQTLE